MPVIHPDLRLMDVEFELWALEEHLVAVEESSQCIAAQDRTRTDAKLREQGLDKNPEEVQIAHDEHDQRVNHIFASLPTRHSSSEGVD